MTRDPLATPKRLRVSQKFFYGLGHVLNDLSASMWFSYLLVYLHYVLKISSSEAGLVLMVGQVADAIFTPIIGIESDRWQSSCWCNSGRRKIWHLIGTVCVLCSFPFIFIECYGCENAHSWALLMLLLPLVVIFQFGWAATQVSHLALIPELTSDKIEREELNIIRYTFDVMSDICVYAVTWSVLEFQCKSPEDSESINQEDASKFRNIIFIITVIGAVFSLLFHLGTKEPKHSIEHEIRSDLGVTSYNANSSYMIWKDWFKEPQFFQLGLLFMGTRLFINLSQIYVPLYLQESLRTSQTMIAIIPLMMFVSGLIVSLLLKPINKFLGKKVSLILFTVIGLTGCIWIGWDHNPGFARHGVFCATVLIGAAGSAMLVNCLSLTADLIGDNVESGAFVYGAMSFADKLSSGIVILIIQTLHDIVCYKCAWYFRAVMSLGVGIAAVICLLVLSVILPQEIGKRHRRTKVLDNSLHIMSENEVTSETRPLLESRILDSTST